MNIFRSIDMGYYHIVIPRESAWDTMNALGEINAL